MVEIWLPYGRSEVHVSIPINDLLGVVEPSAEQPVHDPKLAVSESLRSPLGATQLGEILTSGSTVAVAIDGSMGPRLSVIATAAVIENLQALGVSRENLTVLIGNGGRESGDPELAAALRGEPALQGVGLIDWRRGSKEMTSVGLTSRKTRVEVSGQYAKADVRIAIGEAALDPFTGFGGAQNTVAPGLTSIGTTEAIRSQAFDDKAAPGIIEGNPVLAETFEAANLVGVHLAMNLVTNPRGGLLKVYAGGLEDSWRQAVAEMGEPHKVKAEANADVIVASAGGVRFDFDLYHAIWAIRNVSQIAKKGAVIILMAECSGGLGAEGLSKLSHLDVLGELKRRYILGGEAVHLIKSRLRSNEIVLVSALPRNLTDPLGLSTARTANEALKAAVERHRKRRVLAVTHGCSTLPFLEGEEGDQRQNNHGEVEEGEQLPG